MNEVKNALIKINSTINSESFYNEYQGEYTFKNGIHTIAYNSYSCTEVSFQMRIFFQLRLSMCRYHFAVSINIDTFSLCLLGCIGGYVKNFRKGAYISFEEDNIKNIGIVLSGTIHI